MWEVDAEGLEVLLAAATPAARVHTRRTRTPKWRVLAEAEIARLQRNSSPLLGDLCALCDHITRATIWTRHWTSQLDRYFATVNALLVTRLVTKPLLSGSRLWPGLVMYNLLGKYFFNPARA